MLDYVLEHACFEMDLSMNYDDKVGYVCLGENARNYTIWAKELESKVLKHTYLFSETDMMDFIFPRLHASTVLELRKLDPGQRPTNYGQIMWDLVALDEALGDFDPPASWTYRDGEFFKWYKAFEKYQLE